MSKEIVKPEVVNEDLLPAKITVRPATLKDGFELASVEDQRVGLAEYDARRGFFRQWLLSHLIEGVHYGYPPGCGPSNADEKQWQSKPSLYKSGALLIVDLLKIKVQYKADADAWLQMGSVPGMAVIRCTLTDHKSGTEMGEGHGIFKVGEKRGMNENSAIKMAEKRGLVNAVINAVPIMSDLFTQDMEDQPSPEDRQGEKNATELLNFVLTKMSMASIGGGIEAGKSVCGNIVKDIFPDRKRGEPMTPKQVKRVMDAINRGEYALDSGEKINV